MTVNRATCPVCRRQVPVKVDGTLKRHKAGTPPLSYTCQGAGLPPLGPWPRHHGPLVEAGS